MPYLVSEVTLSSLGSPIEAVEPQEDQRNRDFLSLEDVPKIDPLGWPAVRTNCALLARPVM